MLHATIPWRENADEKHRRVYYHESHQDSKRHRNPRRALGKLFTNTLAGRAGFEEPGDAILLSFDAGVYQAYINLIAEYVTSPSVDAEVVIDRAISMAFVLKHLEEVLNRAYMPFKDIEWISWLINQSRSTLFSIMLKSQEFIMGE